MMPDQRTNEWCCYYLSSDLSRSCQLHSSTSRRSPSRTSSDLQLLFGFVLTGRANTSSDTTHLASLARIFVWGSVWNVSSLIWSVSLLSMRRLCVVATNAFAQRPLEPVQKMEAYWSQAPSPTFTTRCRFALAWVNLHPSSTKLAIFQAALAPAAAMSLSTLSAESFPGACVLPVWKRITYFGD